MTGKTSAVVAALLLAFPAACSLGDDAASAPPSSPSSLPDGSTAGPGGGSDGAAASLSDARAEAAAPADGGVDGHGDATGPADASPPVDAHASGCTGGAYLLCDDFEKGTLDTATWKANTNHGGTIAVDTTRAYSGTHSLHMTGAPTGGVEADVTETKTFAAASSVFYGRMMFTSTPSAADSHVTYVNADGPQATYTLGSQSKTLIALAYFGGSETANHSAASVPVDKWSCLEWKFDAAAGTADYWLDGAALTDMNATGWGKSSFTSMWLGFLFSETDPSPALLEFWFDDVAIATTRIGCP